jgi:hypothetical protein
MFAKRRLRYMCEMFVCPADMPPAPTLIHVPGEAVLANLPTDSPRQTILSMS